MSKQADYLQQIVEAYPSLSVISSRLLSGESQFNDIVIVNEAIVFRFPRIPQNAATLATEVQFLKYLQGRLPLPVPHPTYQYIDPHTGMMTFMGYPLISGEPLWNETLTLLGDDATQDRLARQLAGFLRALHTLPITEVGRILPLRADYDVWATLFAEFQEHLYPVMRPDARVEVTTLFTVLLDDLRRAPVPSVVQHGDFGGSNILYDPQTTTISGIIDFGFVGLGDPAADIASLSCYGESFLARGYAVYPEMEAMLPRARLYRATFALQQALAALHDGNQADFEDGIRNYI